MDWKIEDNKLTRTFEMAGFSDITRRLAELGTIADAANHHPDFAVHGYKFVTFTLFTHSKKSITEKDYALAKEIDRLFDLLLPRN
jgi:4a-hydroxytetrahydrobiopterin dehydratase